PQRCAARGWELLCLRRRARVSARVGGGLGQLQAGVSLGGGGGESLAAPPGRSPGARIPAGPPQEGPGARRSPRSPIREYPADCRGGGRERGSGGGRRTLPGGAG